MRLICAAESSRFAASRGRPEEVEMLDAEPLQLGFVLLEFGDGFAASIGRLVGNSKQL
jgi:hypothetical protein